MERCKARYQSHNYYSGMIEYMVSYITSRPAKPWTHHPASKDEPCLGVCFTRCRIQYIPFCVGWPPHLHKRGCEHMRRIKTVPTRRPAFPKTNPEKYGDKISGYEACAAFFWDPQLIMGPCVTVL